MRLPGLLSDTWSGLVDLLYPPRCLICDDLGEPIVCPDCRADFCPLAPPLCARCSDMITARPTGLCEDCESSPRYFARATAAGRFDRALRLAVHQLKYGGRTRLGDPLGSYLAAHLAADGRWREAELIVPVPLHPSRLRERGFNQAELIARAVARELGLSVDERLLVRRRKTAPQARLKGPERARNVRDAFAAPRPDLTTGKSLLLVDDVITTLHTVDECARMLTAAGARSVQIAAVARGL